MNNDNNGTMSRINFHQAASYLISAARFHITKRLVDRVFVVMDVPCSQNSNQIPNIFRIDQTANRFRGAPHLSSTDICANKRRGADVNKFNLPESRAN
jgi:hypothetical protein